MKLHSLRTGILPNSSSYLVYNEIRPSNLVKEKEDGVQEVGHR